MADDEANNAWRTFAAERSQRDAQNSVDGQKAAAQAAILVNGGAATALLALLAKDGHGADLLKSASWGLLVYALGVFFGMWMYYCAARALEHYGVYWRLVAFPEPGREAKFEQDTANTFFDRSLWLFIMSGIAFVIGSIVVTLVLYCSSK